MQIEIEDLTTAFANAERAGEFVIAMEELVDYNPNRPDDGAEHATGWEAAFRTMSIAARTYLAAARGMHNEGQVTDTINRVQKSLVAVNVAYYNSMDHETRCHLASMRGFQFPEHVEWDDERNVPALVFILNDAYGPDILPKVKVQARALRRAGKDAEAEKLLMVASLRQVVAGSGLEQDLADKVGAAVAAVFAEVAA